MIRYLLFDLGGVLVDLAGEQVLLGWMRGRVDLDGLWRLWLSSPSVRAFETGRCDCDTFARGVIAELDLPVTPAEFVREFSSWIRGPFPGAVAWLRSLRRTFRIGCLSNSNELQWATLSGHGLIEAFDHAIASFRIGHVKPDAGAFAAAIAMIGERPGEICFLDDNQRNVDAATTAGLRAVRVRGLAEARAAIADLDADHGNALRTGT